MNVVRPRALVALFAAATLVSCGESTSPLPEPELDDALEQMTEAQEAAGPAMAMLGGAPVPSADVGLCPYNSSNQRFVCPQVTLNGITLSRYYQLLDASGAAQSAWGADIVAIRSVTDASGTFTSPTPGSGMQITQHDESTLSGLRAATKTLTGTGTATFTVTATGADPMVVNMTRATNLTLPPEPGPNAYPTGTVAMTSSIQGLATTTNMTMTFNGTSTVSMTSTTGPITQTCTMNLATQAPPVCT
jgi:hypothetical protein